MSGIFDQVINYAPPSLLTGTVTYKGTWSAATNTPTLANPPAAITNGHYYVVSAGGTQFSLVFNIGDWIISNGSAWEKVDNTDAVSSVFGRTGAVVGVSTDYSSVGITNTALGASNPSTVAATTITATSTVAATGAVTGSNLSGTNTGDQTITLTGGVTGSGTGSFAATVVTNANLTGDVTSSGNATTLTNAPVIAKVLTGYTSGAGTVAATDSILQAIQKLNGNDGTNANLTGVITSSGNATSIASQTGTGTKFVVDTSPTLVTPNIGIATGTSLAAALNGTLGATTPSSVAATTGTFSSTLGVTGVATLGNGAVLGTPASGNLASCTGYVGTSALVTVGALNSGSITSGFGSIDVGADAISGGAISGTTVAASGTITSTVASGSTTLESTAPYGTGYKQMRLGNNGSTLTVGVESSAGGALLGSSTAYAGILSSGSTVLQLGASGVIAATFTSTGLNSTAIGATTPSTVAATTLTTSSTATFSGNVAVGSSAVTMSTGGNVTAIDTVQVNSGTIRTTLTYDTGVAVIGSYTNHPVSLRVNQTQVGQLTTTGLNSTAIGQTTAAAGSFTTVSTTGTITQAGFPNTLIYGTSSAASALISAAGSSGDRWQFGAGIINAGDWGVTNVTRSVNPIVITGGTTSPTTTFYNNAGAQVVQFSSGGAAITGTLSATGNISSTITSGVAQNTTVTNGGDFNSAWVGNSTTQMFSIRNSSTTAVYLNTQNSIPLRLGVSTGSTAGSTVTQAEITTAGLAVTGSISATYTGAGGGITSLNSDDTSGSIFYAMRSSGGQIGSISRVGTTNAVVYNTTSDARLKENLRDFTDSGRLIDALKPRVFDWKGDTNGDGKDVIGFVAQEEHAADPIFAHIGAVSVGDDDPTTITKQWQRSDAALIPILVAELQSLRKRLAALESK